MKYCCACENFGPRSGSEDGPISTLCQPGVFSSAIRRQQFWAYSKLARDTTAEHGDSSVKCETAGGAARPAEEGRGGALADVNFALFGSTTKSGEGKSRERAPRDHQRWHAGGTQSQTGELHVAFRNDVACGLC